MRDQDWTVGAVGHPTIEAERVDPVRAVYRVRDEHLVERQDQPQPPDGRRGLVAQNLLEFADGLGGIVWGLVRLPFILAGGAGILGIVVMAFMWLITQSDIAIRNALICGGVVVFCFAVQFLTFKIQAACRRWVAKGAR